MKAPDISQADGARHMIGQKPIDTGTWTEQNAVPQDERPSVIALSMDANYIDQAKQVLASLHYHARWEGEYVLLCHGVDAADVEWFVQRGVHIEHVPYLFCNGHLPAVTFSRYVLFQPFVQRWKNVIYLDLDILVRGKLNALLDLDQLGAIQGFKSTIRENFVQEKNPSLYKDLEKMIDLDRPAFNGGVMAFPTHVIDADMFDRACELTTRFLPISRFANQGLLNLLFFDRWTPLSPVYNAYVPTYLGRDGTLLLSDARILHFNGKAMKPWDRNSITFPAFSAEWHSNLALSQQILHLSHARGETHTYNIPTSKAATG